MLPDFRQATGLGGPIHMDVFAQKANGIDIGFGSPLRRPTINTWYENDVLKDFGKAPHRGLSSSTVYQPIIDASFRPVKLNFTDVHQPVIDASYRPIKLNK
jgi:hypothetical protein